MRCPYCGSEKTRVVDTRSSGEIIRRRRKCLSCGRKFTTIERVASQIWVVKRDGRREPFDRQKLLRGLQIACAKRPVPAEALEKMAEQIEDEILSMGKAEVSSQTIGNKALEKLKKLDQVAYIRFTTVYLNIPDLKAIQEEIDRLLNSSN